MTSKPQDVIDGIYFENPNNRELRTTVCPQCGVTMFLWRHQENWLHQDVAWTGPGRSCTGLLRADPIAPMDQCQVVELPNAVMATAVTPGLLRGARLRFSRSGATWLFGPDADVLRVKAQLPGWND